MDRDGAEHTFPSIVSSLAILVVVAGCYRTPPVPPRPVAPRPAPATSRSLSSFKFSDAALKTSATQFNLAAANIYESNWTRHPIAEFLATPQHGPTHSARWKLLQPIEVEHEVELDLNPIHQLPDEIKSVRVTARYYPASGWGAFVRYEVGQDAVEQFGAYSVNFVDCSKSRRRDSSPDFVLRTPIRSWSTVFREEHVRYSFQTTLRKTGYEPISTVDEQIGAYLASPEAFRKSALGDLAALEAKARAGVESGAALNSVANMSNVTAGNPSPTILSQQDVPLTPELKTKALDALLNEIERRRALVERHHQAMYASAQQAFPLYECIRAAAKQED